MFLKISGSFPQKYLNWFIWNFAGNRFVRDVGRIGGHLHRRVGEDFATSRRRWLRSNHRTSVSEIQRSRRCHVCRRRRNQVSLLMSFFQNSTSTCYGRNWDIFRQFFSFHWFIFYLWGGPSCCEFLMNGLPTAITHCMTARSKSLKKKKKKNITWWSSAASSSTTMAGFPADGEFIKALRGWKEELWEYQIIMESCLSLYVETGRRKCAGKK